MTQPLLVDSHCHLHFLDLAEFDNQFDKVMTAAHAEGVKRFLCVSTELNEHEALVAIASRYPEVSISVGVHPNTVCLEEPTLAELTAYARHPACIAMGETGLDYFRMKDESEKSVQHARFRTHIAVAKAQKKPLIIHTRNSSADTLAILKEESADSIGGVMHCFVEDWLTAKQAIDLNFYISFSGIVTFKNAHDLQEVAKKVPLDRILIETDAPYLAPMPYRGKQNQPAYVKHVALKISELRGVDFETVALKTTENFYQCFGISS